MCSHVIYSIYVNKEDFALDNFQGLICHKIQPNQTKPNHTSCGFLQMDALVSVKQQRLTFICSLQTLVAIKRTYQDCWTRRESQGNLYSQHMCLKSHGTSVTNNLFQCQITKLHGFPFQEIPIDSNVLSHAFLSGFYALLLGVYWE